MARTAKEPPVSRGLLRFTAYAAVLVLLLPVAYTGLDGRRGFFDSARGTVSHEGELSVVAFAFHINRHQFSGLEIPKEDLLGELVLDLALHGPAQRPCTHGGIVAAGCQQHLGGGGELDAHTLLRKALAQALEEQIHDLDDLFLDRLGKRLADKGMSIELTPAAKVLLATRGYDPAMGARPLRRTIQREIEDQLSEKILFGEIKPGELISVDVEGEGDEARFTFVGHGAPKAIEEANPAIEAGVGE